LLTFIAPIFLSFRPTGEIPSVAQISCSPFLLSLCDSSYLGMTKCGLLPFVAPFLFVISTKEKSHQLLFFVALNTLLSFRPKGEITSVAPVCCSFFVCHFDEGEIPSVAQISCSPYLLSLCDSSFVGMTKRGNDKLE
jgi:hypothetical protein